uniref:Bromo domain-containing protein n=1 Tax=Chromera velia CCMP2878 TaxID=1169474 RepID=A0A0G4FJ62_9ALVE|eukprot:Cvel_17245.t1-p1 / transcript=Cvel_17245.t1 / gene=Cvel_17245 / organism=Chromera_velia_CCMP2878 / gene_product=Ankyrin repeat, SAM and basic leucine zipper, putative / transcript_product=Ankyrin repeat, SAM and basic leucine zipper, putative / location=Cvel_scaffold1365:34872-38604(+) / protein_length=575 / sequence_SO=supercontig / SO=protein_coding / is_pseudo=false
MRQVPLPVPSLLPQEAQTTSSSSSSTQSPIPDFNAPKIISLLQTGSVEDVKAQSAEVNFLLPDAQQYTAFFCVVVRPKKDFDAAVAICEWLKEGGLDPSFVEPHLNQTCLFFAAREGNLPCTEFLLRNGVNPNHTDKFNQTCLFYAAREGHSSVCDALISGGLNVNHGDSNGDTALNFAAREGRTSTVELLLEKGADPQLKNKQGQNCLAFARKNKRSDASTILARAIAARGGSSAAAAGADSASAPAGGKGKGSKAKAKTKAAGGGGAPAGIKRGHSGGIQERRQKYQLQVRSGDNGWTPAADSNAECERFEAEFPELAVWPQSAEDAETARQRVFADAWYREARNAVQKLFHYSSAEPFKRPVNPVKDGCLDYLSVVKTPMDLSTIKQKVNNRQYASPQEFLSDCKLVFSNCRLYNSSPESVFVRSADHTERYLEQCLRDCSFTERFVDRSLPLESPAVPAGIPQSSPSGSCASLGGSGYTQTGGQGGGLGVSDSGADPAGGVGGGIGSGSSGGTVGRVVSLKRPPPPVAEGGGGGEVKKLKTEEKEEEEGGSTQMDRDGDTKMHVRTEGGGE